MDVRREDAELRAFCRDFVDGVDLPTAGSVIGERVTIVEVA
jgi:hypothetical protein